jgi:hypothetical protein
MKVVFFFILNSKSKLYSCSRCVLLIKSLYIIDVYRQLLKNRGKYSIDFFEKQFNSFRYLGTLPPCPPTTVCCFFLEYEFYI